MIRSVPMMLVLCAGSAMGADWINAVSSNWNDPGNWSSLDVPNVAGESATLGFGTAYTVDMDVNAVLDFLTLSNNLAQLDFNGARQMNIATNTGITNNGTIVLNALSTTADSILQFDVDGPINGTGVIMMMRPGNDARIQGGAGVTITNGVGHTIMGLGRVLPNNLINDGTISADGGILELESLTTNNSLIDALSGGTLRLEEDVTQAAAGEILARGGGVVTMSGAITISGGLLNSTGSGRIERPVGTVTLENVENRAAFDVIGGGALALTGTAFTNNDTIVVNSNLSTADAFIRFDSDLTINGTGTIELTRQVDSRIDSATDITGTIGTNQRVEGGGVINAQLINNGVMSADTLGLTMEMQNNPKTNNGTMEARNGGLLQIENITLTQDPAGLLLADGGDINCISSNTIDGGMIQTTNGGTFFRQAGTTTMNGVIVDGTMDIIGGGFIAITNDLHLDGLVIVNSNLSTADGVLRIDDESTITGNATIQLTDNPDSILSTGVGGILTLDTTAMVQGLGRVSAETINNGMIVADAGRIRLDTGAKTNNNIMEANSGGELEVFALTITQGPAGVMSADNGTLIFTSTCGVDGGMITTANGGTVLSSAATSFVNVDSSATHNLTGAASLAISGSFNHDGILTVNSNASTAVALLRFDDTLTVTGTGTINLTEPFDSIISTAVGETVTMGSGQLIQGTGAIQAAMINDGTIDANAPGERLELNINAKTNNAMIMSTNGGELLFDGVTVAQSATGVVTSDASTIQFDSTNNLSGGTLTTTNGGIVTTNGTLILDDIICDATINQRGAARITIGPNGITNDGVITVNSNTSTAAAILDATADATIDGMGEILLTLFADSLIQTPGGIITIGADQTVRGAGQLNGGFINNGTINADSTGAMEFNCEVDEFINNALVTVTNTGGLTIDGGADFDNRGTVDVPAGFTLATPDGYMQTAGETILNGTMTNNVSAILSAQFNGGRLTGTGTFNGACLIEGATLAPGASPGSMTFTGDLNFAPTGVYEVELAGVGSTEFDTIDVEDIDLDGTVDVIFDGGFFPQSGQGFDIITASGTITGEFASINVLDIGPEAMYVVYQPDRVRLVATCVADVDGSGFVDFDDLNILLGEWATFGTAGDVDGSGFVDFDDLNLLLNAWATACN